MHVVGFCVKGMDFVKFFPFVAEHQVIGHKVVECYGEDYGHEPRDVETYIIPVRLEGAENIIRCPSTSQGMGADIE